MNDKSVSIEALRKLGVIFALVSALGGLLAGCETTRSMPLADPRMMRGVVVNMRVSSLAIYESITAGKKYYISSGLRDVRDDDLQFQEFSKYVENALALNEAKRPGLEGYVRVSRKEDADQLIRLSYGIGNPQTSSQSQISSYGYSYPIGYYWYTVPPTIETTTVTTYSRTLILEAYHLKNPKGVAQIWKSTVESEGSESDLRRILPYLIVGSMAGYGSISPHVQTVRVAGEDPRLLQIWRK